MNNQMSGGTADNVIQAGTLHGGVHISSGSVRFIETYQKAVDHLASERAYIRMAALRALGELGQDYPERRQALVDVICEYLRLPSSVEDVREVQVRSVAQQILREHLRPDRDEEGVSKSAYFWPQIDVNLKGAHLVDANFAFCEFGYANFDETYFEGTTWFSGCTFSSEVRFVGANFDGWLVFLRGRNLKVWPGIDGLPSMLMQISKTLIFQRTQNFLGPGSVRVQTFLE